MGCSVSQQVENKDNIQLDDDLQHELQLNSRYNDPQDKQENTLFAAQQISSQQFMATKPWIGALKEPTNRPNNDPSPPTKELTLKYVNGFRVQDSRKNIFWTKDNTIVFPAASIGIVMDVNTLKQKYMGAGNTKTANGHTDDVISLGISPDKKLAVTGSIGATPLILVWDTQTMQIRGRTKLGRNTRAVSSIRFSKNGKYIFCSDKHNDSNIYCFSYPSFQLKGTGKSGADPVIDAQTGNQNTFACATKGGVWFFQFQENEGLTQGRGIFGSSPRTAMCAISYSSESNLFLSGSIDGLIYYWASKTCTKSRKFHQGAVMAIQVVGSNVYSSGGRDNLLKISNISGQVIKEIQLPGYAKSIDQLNSKIIVGTKCGRIITIQNQVSKTIMHCHYTGQAWGCAIGRDGFVYTTCDDNTILGFNTKTNLVQKQGIINKIPGKKYKIGGASTLSLLPPNQQARAIATNKAGHVAIATNDGDISIRRSNDLNNQIFHAKQNNQWIEVIRYSPDEKKLAVGSHDNNIYIYSVTGDSYSKIGVLRGHNAFITGLDFSTDGNSIQSVCGAYQILFWDLQSMTQVKQGGTRYRNQKWATLSVKIAWGIQGIFPPATMGTHVNGVDRSKDSKYCVIADNWGLINLYRYPCLQGGKANSFRAHSSHVVRAILDEKDQYIYSIGGYDKTLMVWKVS